MSKDPQVPSAVARAMNLVESGDLSGGLLAFEEAAELHPRDVRSWLGLAAVRHKRGEESMAVDAFARAACIYVNEDQGLKAIAVYKQATRIAPLRDDLALELAIQYRNQGLGIEAVEQLLSAVNARASRGESLDCLSVIRTTLELDKDNLSDRVRLAESFSARGRIADAMDIFREVIDLVDSELHPEVYESVARRMAHHGDPPISVLIDLAGMDLSRAAYTEGLTLLRRAHQRAPRDTRVLTGIADAFEGLGQVQPAVVAMRHLAEIYLEGGLTDEHGQALARILAMAPDDPWARRALDGESAMPLESLVFEQHAQNRGDFERTLSEDDAVEIELASAEPQDDSLVQRYGSGLDALFAATARGESTEAPVEEIATRDIVAIENVDGIEFLATRDILSVDLSLEEAALLELDSPLDDEEEIEVLATRDILSVDPSPQEAALLELDSPLGDEEDIEVLATRDILSVDLNLADQEALSIEAPEIDE
jgi:tetratricopeptide (TPR) repeat protein